MGKVKRTRSTVLPNGFIYKVSSEDGKLVYYGASDDVETRMSFHVYHYNLYLKNKYHYNTINEILKLGNYTYETIKEYKNITWGDLFDIEEDFIVIYDCVNKIHKKDSKNPNYMKNYYLCNDVRLKEKFKCEDCKGKYTYSNKSIHSKTNKHIKALKMKIEQQQKQINLLIEKVNQPKPKIILKIKNCDINTLTVNN